MAINNIISLSGYGYSGSGAVMDLLCEFEDVESVDFEFQILYFPDGIADLDYKLNESCVRFYDSDLAINRFLTLCKKWEVDYEPLFHGHLYDMAKEYVDNITSLQWNSYWAYDRLGYGREHYKNIEDVNERIYRQNRRRAFINKFLRSLKLQQLTIKPYVECFNSRPMYLSIKPDKFIEHTRQFMNKILRFINTNNKTVVFDQFLPPHNPSKYFKYINIPIKSIVVERDPRDTWIMSCVKKISFIPHDNLQDFIIWYRENNKQSIIVEDESVLRIKFEDIIYRYRETVDLIKSFTTLENHIFPKQKFNPNISINNTQLVLKYPEYKDDIKIIEKELSEFLYDFSKYNVKPSFNTEMF